MKKLILFVAAVSVFIVPSAFAKNLGVLSNDQVPQNLVQANDFLNTVNSANSNATTENAPAANGDHHIQNRNSNSLGCGWGCGWGGWGGWGSYFPSYYPYYYYPYYDYGYPYYGYGYGYGYPYYGWYLNENHTGAQPHININNANATAPNAATAHSTVHMDAAHAPVVCFASDATGTWYANADLAANVMKTQEASNRECLASGENCSQNLGCAIAYGDNANHANTANNPADTNTTR